MTTKSITINYHHKYLALEAKFDAVRDLRKYFRHKSKGTIENDNAKRIAHSDLEVQ